MSRPADSQPVVPVALERHGEAELLIAWSDGQRRVYRFHELRAACPCAVCRDEQTHPQPLMPVISAEQAQPARPQSMEPVGRYAYQIMWNDGHSSGIYTFDYLRQLGRPADPEGVPGAN